jgi:trans-aconitate 2-methyltransferase
MTPAREWDAISYDKVAAPMTTRGVELVDELELRGDETVMDAGCGTGQVTAHLLSRLPEGRVIAVDGSEEMLRVAGERFGDDPRVSLVRAELEAPLPIDGAVDAIVSTSTFHWVQNHDALWRNLAAVLRPGGVLASECGGFGNIASIVDVIGTNGTWTFATPEDTLRRLEAAGFVDASAVLVPRPAQIPAEEFVEYLRTVVLGAHMIKLGREAGEALVGRVAAALPEPVVDYVRLVVRARRA